MKKIIALILSAALILCFAACKNKNSSSSSTIPQDSASSQNSSDVAVDGEGNIVDYSADKNEEHTITDEGDTLTRTTNELLGTASFVLDSCALSVACSEGTFETVISTDSLDAKYYCRTVQREVAFDKDTSITAAEFNEAVYNYYGVKLDSKTFQISGIASYANGSYSVSAFNDPAAWGLAFSTAEALGNGFVRYTGTFSYSTMGDLEEEVMYDTVCLIKHTSASKYGYNLVSFSLTPAAADSEE